MPHIHIYDAFITPFQIIENLTNHQFHESGQYYFNLNVSALSNYIFIERLCDLFAKEYVILSVTRPIPKG